MQLLWKYPFADGRYVSESAWEHAILDVCPFHPEGGCGVETVEQRGGQQLVSDIQSLVSHIQSLVSLIPSPLSLAARSSADPR